MWKIAVFVCLVVAARAKPHVPPTTDAHKTACNLIAVQDCNIFAQHQVCATDGATYDNKCMFAKVQCKDDSLHIVHNGSCHATSNQTMPDLHGSMHTYEVFCEHISHEACGNEVVMVCGSDHKTYVNLCYFEKARCQNHTLFIAEYTDCKTAGFP